MFVLFTMKCRDADRIYEDSDTFSSAQEVLECLKTKRKRFDAEWVKAKFTFDGVKITMKMRGYPCYSDDL